MAVGQPPCTHLPSRFSSYILRRPVIGTRFCRGRDFVAGSGEAASDAWREPAEFSIIEGLPKGSGKAQAVDSARALDDGGRSSVGRAPGCDPGRRGFESHRPPHLPGRTVSGPLAQLVEQETLNLLVVGSTPTRPTKFKHLCDSLKGCRRALRIVNRWRDVSERGTP
jgi:hypothetical protein